MLHTFRNTDSEHRVWPTLVTPDGKTVDLKPNETVCLNLSDDFKDPHLQIAKPPYSRITKKATKSTKET